MRTLKISATVVCTLFVVLVFLSATKLNAGGFKNDRTAACVPIQIAVQQPNRDLCINGHVYDVVELKDGTRFLDLCPVELSDADCRFLVMSLREDREDVGELGKYRDHDIKMRGLVRPIHGRMGMMLSNIRQLSGGPEKFRPNKKLLKGFDGQSDTMPVRDTNLTSSGHHRSFMNRRDREELPAK